jgi:hypothetical protein
VIRKLSLALVALFVLPLVASAATFTQQLDYTGLENKLISQTFHAVVRGVDAQGTPIVVSPALLNNNDVIVTLYRVQSLLVNNVNKAFTDGAVLYSVTKYIAPGALLATPDPYGKLSSANPNFTNVLGLFNPASLPAMSGNVQTDITNNVVGSALFQAANTNNATDYIFGTPGGGLASPLLKLFNLSQNGGSLTLAANATNGTDVTGYDINPFPSFGQWFSTGTSTMSFALVPEPGTIALWGAGLAIGAVVAFRRRKQS